MEHMNYTGEFFNNALGVQGALANSTSLAQEETREASLGRIVKDTARDALAVVKETGEDVVDEFREQRDKLDKKERLFPSIPNSILVLSLVGLLVFSIVKK